MRRIVAFNTYDYAEGVSRANRVASIYIGGARLPAIGPLVARMENKPALGIVLRGGLADGSKLPNHYLAELRRKRAAADSRRKYEETGEVDIVAAYSEVDQPAVNHGPVGSYDYNLNEARGNVPEYRNESALMGLAEFLEFDPVGKASAVTTPTMVVHSDGCAFPAAAKKFYSELRGQKELVWADGTHYDYYDSQPQIDNAVANVTRFFRTHVAEDRA